MYQDYKVGEHKANKGLRFLNFIIDYVSIILLTMLFFGFIAIVIVIINPESDIIYQLENINPLIDRVITAFFYVLLIFLSEFLTKGRSLGKFITGTKVVMIDGSTPTTKDYFTRSICRIIPFDVLTFLGENGWHDKISKTTIVNKKAFEADLSQADNIESIGKTEFE
ncbi:MULTISPECIES: RDD family protein [Empedobacter]|uniref:RDD family protein n=1 Tax=Empedobacter TaxID=59734 RepID=UPI000570F67C|nr:MULTISPECIES: RDD family protein [Empedobacter]MBY0067078.1 RDD family protein [Empedobacter falsenii]MDH2205569.1 RDD family protein [Empedobacter sp. GD03644]MDM1137446.1 RDD family protein [Empedobacter sp. R132-2]